MFRRLPLLLCASAWLASCHEMPAPSAATAPGGAPMRAWSFEDSAAGALPPGWSAAETNSAGTPGAWMVMADAKAPDGKQLLRLGPVVNEGETFNLLLSTDTYPADLDLAVWVHADAGVEDQGGGLVWRAQDASNYWIARWNPLESNLRVYQVQGGKRRQLATAKTSARDTAWHELRIVARGAQVTVRLDGSTQLSVEDAGLPDGGRIGFWTKADAATSFDLLRLGVPSPPMGQVPGPEPR